MVVLAGGRLAVGDGDPVADRRRSSLVLGVALAMLAAAYPARIAAPDLDRPGRRLRVTRMLDSRPSVATPGDPRTSGASMTIALPRLDRSMPRERGLTLADFLVPIRVGERIGTRVRHVVLIVAGALFIYLTALLVIPHEPVPFTGQTFGVLVVGGALGFRRGFASVSLYVLLGVVGLPFFAEGKGGIAIIWGATGGYLIGFVIAGAVVGRLAELGWDRHIGGRARGDGHRQRDHLRDRRAVAEAVDRHDLDGGHRRRPDAVPRLGHGQAGRRGRDLPGRLVAHRPAAGRPLSRVQPDPGLYGPAIRGAGG